MATKRFDLASSIIAFESGELNEEKTLELFAHLVKTGLAWKLQGFYGRTANDLIESGLISQSGNVLVENRGKNATYQPEPNKPTRKLWQIAGEIRKDWKHVSYSAEPYLAALEELSGIDQPYGVDTGESVVRYFLANASSWRGETARRIKQELRDLIGD